MNEGNSHYQFVKKGLFIPRPGSLKSYQIQDEIIIKSLNSKNPKLNEKQKKKSDFSQKKYFLYIKKILSVPKRN